MKRISPQARLDALAGDAFLLELTPRSLRCLLSGHKLDIPDLALLTNRSTSFLEKLLRGEKRFSTGMCDELARLFHIKPVLTPHPDAEPFFCELTGRSLRIFRKAEGLTDKALADRTSLNHEHLGRIQLGKRVAGEDVALALGQALKIRFVFVPK